MRNIGYVVDRRDGQRKELLELGPSWTVVRNPRSRSAHRYNPLHHEIERHAPAVAPRDYEVYAGSAQAPRLPSTQPFQALSILASPRPHHMSLHSAFSRIPTPPPVFPQPPNGAPREGRGLFLELPCMEMGATVEMSWSHRNLEGDIRWSNAQNPAGPELGRWLRDWGYVYYDAQELFGVSTYTLQQAVRTGMVSDNNVRQSIYGRTGIWLG